MQLPDPLPQVVLTSSDRDRKLPSLVNSPELVRASLRHSLSRYFPALCCAIM